MDIITRLKTGDFNYRSSETQPDGSVVVIMRKRGDPAIYKVKVRNLYQANEVIEWQETLKSGRQSS